MNSEAQEHTLKNYYPMPNKIFSLGLKSGEFMVYSYLMHVENRKTFTAYPSYATIGKACGMCENTVAKHVHALEAKGFITTEPTTTPSAEGWPRNGTLRYTVRPLREAEERYYARQMEAVKLAAEKQKAAQRLEALDSRAPL